MLLDVANGAFWVLLITEAAGSSYVMLLVVASLLPGSKRPRRNLGAPTRFCVIVPAHDEEAMLASTLRSLLSQAYASADYSIHVIADNCTDATADIARGFGVTVHERFEPDNRGKGQALRWLLEQLSGKNDIDAFVFVDADTVVDANFLTSMDARTAAGEQLIQASYRVQDPDSHPLVALRALAFALMHDLRGRGKARLGISCGLWGNGMVMARDSVDARQWQSFSPVEDAEQHLRLLLLGKRVAFAPETHVYGHMPGSFRASRSQQERWEGGRLSLARRYAPRLALTALRQRDLSLLAALTELLLPPLSVQAALACGLAALAWLVADTQAAILATACLGVLGGYVVCGLVRARLSMRAYASLGYAPIYIGWKVWLFTTELLKTREPAWTRTSRDG